MYQQNPGHLTMVPKVTLIGLLRYVYQKKIFFSSKINQNRIPKNSFDLQNDFNEDLLSLPVYGEKLNLGHFRLFLRLIVKFIDKCFY
jgi:hypothetical protein